MNDYGEQQINLEPENVEQQIELEEEPVIINQGGTQNYNELRNKPSINGITLQGNKNGADYNLADIYSVVFTAGEQGAIYASQEDLDYIYANVPTYMKVSGNVSGTEINQIYVLLGENNIEGSYSGELIYFTYQDWSNNYNMVRIPKNASSALNFDEYDFYTKSESDNKYQAKLVSGTNIKTINNQSILGGGNLNIDPGGGANLTPLEVPNDSMILYNFIMDAEAPETYTISNDSDVAISIEKESGTDEVWVQKGSIISVYPQYSATILSADGMYMYYVDLESEQYLTGGGAVDYDTVVDIIQQQIGEGFVDLTSDQTITGKKTFKDKGIEFSKTGTNVKTALEPANNGVSLTFTDAQGNKSTKLGVGSQYTTTDQDLIPRNDYSYNAMTGEYTGTNLGKSDKKYNLIYVRALTDGTNTKGLGEILTNNASLIPESSAVYTLGSTNNRWNGLYLYGNIEMSLGYINQVRAITANEYRVKDGNFNNNYYSLLKYAYVSPGKTVAQLQNGIDVNNRVIHNIGTPDDDTSPISKGYADSHYQGTLTFDSVPTDGSSNPVTSNGVFDAIQNVTEIAEGKTATYTIAYSTTGNTDFNSQDNSITVSSFIDTAGNTITDEDVKIGDIVLIVEVDVPDRWVQSIDTTNHTITFYKMETSKIDLTNYQEKIDNSHKLSSDLVDDTNHTNKFVTTNEKTSWDSKYTKPSGGIPDTDLSSAVQISLGKADTAIQDVSGLVPKTTTIASVDLQNDITKSEMQTALGVSDMVTLSQADYDALVTKDPDTFYFIEEE